MFSDVMSSDVTARTGVLLRVRGGGALEGAVSVPGDKSLSHRVLMLAAIADGETRIDGLSACADVGRTLAALRLLGIPIDGEPPGAVVVHGSGLRGLEGPAAVVDCGDSGTTMRLLAGLLAGQGRPFTLDGSAALRRRPMARVVEPLRDLGFRVTAGEGGRPPIVFHGGSRDPVPADARSHEAIRTSAAATYPSRSPAPPTTFDLERASAQVGSAILLAALGVEGETVVRYPAPVRDHTERLLATMGAPVRRDGLESRLTGPVDRLEPPGGGRYTVAPDPSGAAFALAAAAIVPGSRVIAAGLNVNPGRVGLFEILRRMGARIEWRPGPERFGEPTADIEVAASGLSAIEVGADLVPISIDELPLFAVLATQARGRSVLRVAEELRVKECDRIAAIVEGLRRMGARIEERPDGFEVEGPTRLHGARVDGHGDHRIVMALAVAGLVADGETIVSDGDRPADSYPGFVEAMRRLGARIELGATPAV